VDKFVIQGGRRLSGKVKIGGAKNAALILMAASILGRSKSVIRRVPHLSDVVMQGKILQELGMKLSFGQGGRLEVEPEDSAPSVAPYKLVRKLRGSVCVLGPLLGSRRHVRVSMPGGCIIGTRPIDLHVKGLRALNADVRVEHGYVVADAPDLRGGEVYMGGPFGSTVLGTANVMMAASVAKGRTVIHCAACEPEIQDLAKFLNKMGARIRGAGSPTITINGVKELHGAEHEVIPDRIEAITFMLAGAITKGDVTVTHCRPEHVSAAIDKLQEMGAAVTKGRNWVRVACNRRLKAADMTTLPYPGLPTDAQAQQMALLSVSNGTSVVTEKVFPDRFMHIAELNRMGADIRKEGPTAVVVGVPRLSGAPVMASDLRASAGLVLAALAAKGKSVIRRVYHIDRGYERIEEKFKVLNGRISRVPDETGSDDEE